MLDKLRCFDLWTVRRLKSNDLSRKNWKDDSNWTPCTFSYREEYERVENCHYEESVFEQMEMTAENQDLEEEFCLESFHYDGSSSFNTDEDSIRQISQDYVHQEPEEPVATSEELPLYMPLDEPEVAPEQNEEEPSAGDAMFSPEPMYDLQEQDENLWGQDNQDQNEE